MRSLVCTLFLFAASPALAQQSTALDRVGFNLSKCIVTAETEADQIADLQKQVAAAQIRIKQLEAEAKTVAGQPAPRGGLEATPPPQ